MYQRYSRNLMHIFVYCVSNSEFIVLKQKSYEIQIMKTFEGLTIIVLSDFTYSFRFYTV